MAAGPRMKGKRVLVTGSGTGIGKGVALEFCREGADVVFHYAHSRDGAMAAVDQARREAPPSHGLSGRSLPARRPADFAAEAIDFLGGIDILVNNAGITMNVPFENVTQEQFDTVFGVNIRATYF